MKITCNVSCYVDDSEVMGERSTEFGVRSADYDQDNNGDESVSNQFTDHQQFLNSCNSFPLTQMDLQRRGHSAGLGANKGRVYWRCYFNAVTCF